MIPDHHSAEQLRMMQEVFHGATAAAAIAAFKTIDQLHRQYPEQDRDYKALGRLVDEAAVVAMREVFETQSDLSINIRGSEGRKDTRRDGIKSSDLYGMFGPPSGIRVAVVNDAVEGTGAAAKNQPCATSVVAANLDINGGLLATGDFDYMSKLFGPPQTVGKMSLDYSPRENMRAAMRALRIRNPQELAVVILDRERNKREIDAAQELGVTHIPIQAGDLMPSILAVRHPNVIKTIKDGRVPNSIKGLLVMGSGGWEEGVIAAAAAKALGGLAEGRIYSTDQDIIEQARVMGIDELVPGPQSHAVVFATPITDDPWNGVVGIQRTEAGYQTQTISITHEGFRVISSTRQAA